MSYSTDIARYRKGGIPPIVLLCAAVYMVSYITRINYSAVVVEIVASGAFSAQQASLPLTALFITYGFGQLVDDVRAMREKDSTPATPEAPSSNFYNNLPEL